MPDADPSTPQGRDDLRALAEAATPGPWVAEHRGCEVYETQSPHGDLVLEAGLRAVDARYAAAVDPTTVLALLDALDAAEARGKEAVRHLTAIRDDSATPMHIAADLDQVLVEVLGVNADAPETTGTTVTEWGVEHSTGVVVAFGTKRWAQAAAQHTAGREGARLMRRTITTTPWQPVEPTPTGDGGDQ